MSKMFSDYAISRIAAALAEIQNDGGVEHVRTGDDQADQRGSGAGGEGSAEAAGRAPGARLQGLGAAQAGEVEQLGGAADVEQQAREMLAAGLKHSGQHVLAAMVLNEHCNESMRVAIDVIADTLRQQPAPVDLEQFRGAVSCWYDAALPANDVEAERKAEAKRLLSVIDNAGKVAIAEPVAWIRFRSDGGWEGPIHNCQIDEIRRSSGAWTPLYTAPHQPAPVVDDAMRELIEQRDALVGVLFDLIQSLPKGARSLSSNAQGHARDGATLACAIFDKADVDPEAYDRYARSLWGTEYRTKPEELKARRAAALARAQGVRS